MIKYKNFLYYMIFIFYKKSFKNLYSIICRTDIVKI